MSKEESICICSGMPFKLSEASHKILQSVPKKVLRFDISPVGENSYAHVHYLST